jgi:hypothetical protein
MRGLYSPSRAASPARTPCRRPAKITCCGERGESQDNRSHWYHCTLRCEPGCASAPAYPWANFIRPEASSVAGVFRVPVY